MYLRQFDNSLTDPYRLASDIRGVGFRTADQIAAKLGIEKTALIRVRAGIGYALTEAMDEGHCGLPTEELIPLTRTLLEVPRELVETALGHELEGGSVIAGVCSGYSVATCPRTTYIFARRRCFRVEPWAALRRG